MLIRIMVGQCVLPHLDLPEDKQLIPVDGGRFCLSRAAGGMCREPFGLGGGRWGLTDGGLCLFPAKGGRQDAELGLECLAEGDVAFPAAEVRDGRNGQVLLQEIAGAGQPGVEKRVRHRHPGRGLEAELGAPS